jgi:protein TonB
MKVMKTTYHLLFALLLVIPIFAGAQQKSMEPGEEDVYLLADDKPEFPGGEDALKAFITANVDYPEEAKKNRITGKVFVSFVIDKEGKVVMVKIAKGVDPSLDKEALRVVNSMPAWKPGKHEGKLVKVKFTVPIAFALS